MNYLLGWVALTVEPVLQVENSSPLVPGRIQNKSSTHKVRRNFPRPTDDDEERSAKVQVVQVAEESQSPNGWVEVGEVIRELEDPICFVFFGVVAEGPRWFSNEFLSIGPPFSLQNCASRGNQAG